MAVAFEPFGEYVLLEPEKAPEKTASGIYIPESAQEKPKKAKVLAVGEEVKYAKVGDVVLYREAYDNDSFDKDKYVVTLEKNISGKFKEA